MTATKTMAERLDDEVRLVGNLVVNPGHMSYSLNSFKGYIGDYIGDYYRGY